MQNFSNYRAWILLECLFVAYIRNSQNSEKFLITRIDFSIDDYLPFKIAVARQYVGLVSKILDLEGIPSWVAKQSLMYAQKHEMAYQLLTYINALHYSEYPPIFGAKMA